MIVWMVMVKNEANITHTIREMSVVEYVSISNYYLNYTLFKI